MPDPYVERDIGAKAQRLLEDQAFIEAITRLKDKMMSGWLNSKSDEGEEREELYRMLKLLDSLQAQLAGMVSDGTLAHKQIEKEEANG